MQRITYYHISSYAFGFSVDHKRTGVIHRWKNDGHHEAPANREERVKPWAIKMNEGFSGALEGTRYSSRAQAEEAIEAYYK